MIETYFEQCNTLENPTANKVKKLFLKIVYYLSIVLGVILIIVIFSLPIFPKETPWQQVLVFVLLWFIMPISLFIGAFFTKKLINSINPIYDYVLNGRDFYILRIYDNAKRKKFLKINVSQMSAIGKISLDSYNRYASDPHIKKVFALTNPQNEENIYYMLYSDAEKKVLLHFEPNEECLMYIRRTLGRDIVARN
ncbi:MAG TPA: hypothetical protein VIL24_03345 [Clostridia bacterium]